MTERLIIQPDGLYAIYSTIIDDLVLWDCTAQELEDHYASKAEAEERERIRLWLEKPRPGRKHFSPEEAARWVGDVHGNEEAAECLKKLRGEES